MRSRTFSGSSSNTQYAALKDTMRVFNEACTFITEIAFRERCASKSALQKLVYAEVRQQFGLSAQLTIAKVVEAYKRDKTKQCFFKPTGAVVYDRRILSFKGLEFASLLTLEGRLTVPMQMSEYQRLRFGHGHGQADLVLVDGIFYLLVVETPAAPPLEPTGFIGVDLGIVHIASDSDDDRSRATWLKTPAAATTNSEDIRNPVARVPPAATCNASGARKAGSGEIRTMPSPKSSSREPKTPDAASSWNR